jgi:putative nucleotidyltransferase with HDIG domain
MKIAFRGSRETLKNFIVILAGEHQFVQEGEEDALIVEIESIETLYKLPKKFEIPVLFYITTRDRQVIDSIRDYQISGIFTPPLKKDDVVKKIDMTYAATPKGRSLGEFDTLKAKVIAKAESIPALPALARELLKLSRSDDSQIKDFILKIKKDQGISSKIIRLVNSPFYGLKREVNSIDRATVLLGINTVKNLALAVSTEGYYNKHFNMYKSSGQKIWEHAVAVALLSEAMANLIGEDGDALYLGGLMHDIGKSILVDFLVKEVVTTEDELAQLGIDHTTVGATVLKKWAVSDNIVTAVMNHHSKTQDNFSKIIYHANKLEQSRAEYKDILAKAAADLGKTEQELTAAIAEIMETKMEEADDNT